MRVGVPKPVGRHQVAGSRITVGSNPAEAERDRMGPKQIEDCLPRVQFESSNSVPPPDHRRSGRSRCVHFTAEVLTSIPPLACMSALCL
jgi:hypothetical protein